MKRGAFPILAAVIFSAASLAAGKRVVRGGSWRDRPKRCRSAFRLAYPPWHVVYNVGFRVVAGG